MSRAIQPGSTIDRYRVERRIGSGSMGDVFLGVDIGLDRKVALKILSERHRDNRELRARFVREAKAVAAIAHPNVVQVFTTGTFDGRPYIAMEFLDGTDLGTWVEENQPLSSAQAARAVLDVARGLNAAARAGLIHRDVKPSNLVLLRDGAVKVTDFGLAKPMEAGDQPALTALGVVVGTPDYIAPEQARGDAIDQRVDIYALGGTLFYLLTGMPPFRTGNPHQDKYLKVVARHLKDPPPDASARNPSVDRQLARLVRRMMAKDPALRPDYETLMQQLEAMAGRLERESGAVVPLGKDRGRAPGSDRLSPMPVAAGAEPAAQDTVVTPAMDDMIADMHGDDAMATQVHMRSAGLPRAGSSGVGAYGPSSSESMPVVRAPGLPRWLWVLTIVAALVFVAGIGLHFFGPLPGPAGEKSAASPTPTTTAPRTADQGVSSDPAGSKP